jgi:hypothetical protein
MPRVLILACDQHANWAFRRDSRARLEAIFPQTKLEFHALRIRSAADIWAAYRLLDHGCRTGEWPGGVDYWSWAIDGMTELQALNMDRILEDGQHDIPEMNDYKALQMELRTLVLRFMALPMHGLVTCATEDIGDKDRPLWSPALTGRMSQELPTHMDVVGYIEIQSDDPEAQGYRRIHVQPGRKWVAKDLTAKLPPEMGQNMQNWLNKILGEGWRDAARAARKAAKAAAPTDGPAGRDGTPAIQADGADGETPPVVDTDAAEAAYHDAAIRAHEEKAKADAEAAGQAAEALGDGEQDALPF